MDISMDIHAKSVDMDMDMDGKFHIHGNPDKNRYITRASGNLGPVPPISVNSNSRATSANSSSVKWVSQLIV